MIDRDALIKAALTPADDLIPPAGLAEDIARAVSSTPQRRPGFASRGGWRALPQTMAGLAPLIVLTALLLAAALFAILARSAPPLPPAVSGYHGGGGLTGEMPGPGPAGPVHVQWEHRLAGPMTALIMPLVEDGRIHAADGNGSLTTLDADTGALVRTASVLDSIGGTPVLAGSRLIVGSTEGTVLALDVSTGAELWRHDVGAPVRASLAATGDVSLVGGGDGFVHVLDVETGSERGKVAAGGPVERSPAVDDGVAYTGAIGGRLTAWDVATLAIQWSVELGPGEVMTPAVSEGTMYVAHGLPDLSAPYEAVALDTVDGAISWRWTPPTSQRIFIGAVAGRWVWVHSEDGTVYRIDRATGAGGPFLITQGPVGSLGTVVGNTLYVASSDRRIYAVDTESGTELWRVEVTGSPTIPVVVGGRVVVGTDLGVLVSIASDGR
jgi:outer membrane protein assembly factor BamB